MRGKNVSLTVVRKDDARAGGIESKFAASQISILVADSDQIVRCGLSYLLQSTDHLDACGEVGDIDSLLLEVSRLQPDVLLLSDKLHGLSLPDGLERVKARSPNTRVL